MVFRHKHTLKGQIKKRRTPNERFGASGAVPRTKGSADFEVLWLVSSVVKAPPA